MLFNDEQLRKTISLMKPNNQSFEVRVKYKEKVVYSGYFNDIDILVNEMKKLPDKDCNAYMTLNELHDACMSRSQRNVFIKKTEAQTSDNDVLGYDWLLVDLDPKRPADTSSSDEELKLSKSKCEKVYHFMEQVGFSKPITAMSGNGYHLLYKVCLKNTKENKELISNCLKTLDMLFSDDYVQVDISVFNQSRICKLYGTVAQKGKNTKERPHRMSFIYGNEDIEIRNTDRGYLTKLCGLAPQIEKPQKYNNYNAKEFDLVGWMNKYGLSYRESSWNGGSKYVLKCCPFDSSHESPDSAIFRANDGAIGFRCLHNSCADKSWKDVRLLYEPDAYEKKHQEYENRIYRNFNRDKKKESKPIVVKEGNPVFYTAKDVYNLPISEEEFIRTGVNLIDKRLRGLKKGYVSVVSGLRASSKSTILSQIGLTAIDEGNNVGIFSGELTAKNFMKWMNLQASGKANVEPTQYEGYYITRRETQKKIAEWMDNHFWLYNNDYGNDFEAILNEFLKCIEQNSLDLLILDNLMAFNISSLADTKWDAQTQFVLKLQKLAKEKNVHILFVAHPRKALGFLRLDDISGTGDLANAVDNAFIVHRVNNDFKRLSKQMFGWKDEDPIYQATNCIEVAKDRDGGLCDYFVPLFYEVETKRLKNSISENVIYGWDKENKGFLQLDMDEEAPFG